LGKPAWELTAEVGKEKIAHGAPEPQRPTEDVAQLSPEEQAGSRIFTGKGGCVGCHNAGSGGGTTGPNLSHIGTDGATRKPGMDASAYIHESMLDPQAYIVAGYAAVMPSFRGTLTEEEINSVVAYLLTKQ
jgi:mono/diheme cytochrome c family protein